MRKNYFIIIAFFLAFFFHPREAKADFEVFQGVLMKVKVVVDKGNNFIKDVQSQVKDLTKDTTGVFGAYKDVKKEYDDTKSQISDAKSQVNDAKSNITDSADIAKNVIKNKDFNSTGLARLNSQINTVKLPAVLKDVEDKNGNINEKKLSVAVEKQYAATLGGGYDTEVVREKNLEINSVQRENIAALLAESYNLLYRLDQEQEVTEKEEEATANKGDNTRIRDEVQRKLAAEMKTLARENRVNSIKSAIYAIETQERTRSLQKHVRNDSTGQTDNLEQGE